MVVPTRDSGRSLLLLLDSLARQTMRDYELIVVDRFSQDSTTSLATGAGARVFRADSERSEARNLGARQARSDFLLFLDSDMELSPTVLEGCLREFAAHDALCIKESVVGAENYWARARALEKEGYFHSVYFEAARGYRKRMFEGVGGYDPALFADEDMDLQSRALRANCRLGWVSEPIWHHEEDLGFWKYLEKRRYAARCDRIIAERNPELWRRVRDPRLRWRFLARAIRSSGSRSSWTLVPGLIALRSMEFLIRLRL